MARGVEMQLSRVFADVALRQVLLRVFERSLSKTKS